MNNLCSMVADNCLSSHDAVSLYMLLYLNQRYPNEFLENRNPIITTTHQFKSAKFADLIQFTSIRTQERLTKQKVNTLFELVNTFNLHGVPLSARTALVNWYKGVCLLELTVNRVPTSVEVARMQARGARCVTLVCDHLDELVLGERDPLSFVLHDLVHAYKMFNNTYLLTGQIGFSKAIVKLFDVESSPLDSLLASDSIFTAEFDYLISDMNSHPKHLFHYFKAILVNAYKRKYKLSDQYLSGHAFEEFSQTFEWCLERFEMNEDEKEIARKILMPVNQTNKDTTGKLAESSRMNLIDFTLLDKYFLNLSKI